MKWEALARHAEGDRGRDFGIQRSYGEDRRFGDEGKDVEAEEENRQMDKDDKDGYEQEPSSEKCDKRLVQLVLSVRWLLQFL